MFNIKTVNNAEMNNIPSTVVHIENIEETDTQNKPFRRLLFSFLDQMFTKLPFLQRENK